MLLALDILLAALIVLLPGILLFRDWRYADKRTRQHHRITKTILLLTVFAGLLSGVTTWRNRHVQDSVRESLATLSDESLKQGGFALFLNGARLQPSNTVALNELTVGKTGSEYPLRFFVISTNDVPARSLQCAVGVPDTVRLRLPADWAQGTAYIPNESGISEPTQTHIYASLTQPTLVRGNPSIADLAIPDDQPLPREMFIAFWAEAERHHPGYWRIKIHLEEGMTHPGP